MSPSSAERPQPAEDGACRTRLVRLVLGFSNYVAAYLLGIVLSVLLTPVELELAGVVLWPWYLAFAVPGVFLLYFYLPPPYWPFPSTSYWVFLAIAIVPVLFEAVVHFGRISRLRPWRPLWIGVPVGFAGTLGVYYTAAASI